MHSAWICVGVALLQLLDGRRSPGVSLLFCFTPLGLLLQQEDWEETIAPAAAKGFARSLDAAGPPLLLLLRHSRVDSAKSAAAAAAAGVAAVKGQLRAVCCSCAFRTFAAALAAAAAAAARLMHCLLVLLLLLLLLLLRCLLLLLDEILPTLKAAAALPVSSRGRVSLALSIITRAAANCRTAGAPLRAQQQLLQQLHTPGIKTMDTIALLQVTLLLLLLLLLLQLGLAAAVAASVAAAGYVTAAAAVAVS